MLLIQDEYSILVPQQKLSWKLGTPTRRWILQFVLLIWHGYTRDIVASIPIPSYSTRDKI
jgi:hypothetical protein